MSSISPKPVVAPSLQHPSPSTRIIRCGFAYFALVFAAGFALGFIRVLFLVPRLGVRTAELLEMPLMLLVVVSAAKFVVKRFALPCTLDVRLSVGVMALALLVAAELALAFVLQGQSPGEYIAGRDPVSGSVYLAMLGLFAAMPLILARAWPSALRSGHERA